MKANSGNPDETPRSVASDLGLHCLPFSWLMWVKPFILHIELQSQYEMTNTLTDVFMSPGVGSLKFSCYIFSAPSTFIPQKYFHFVP